MKKQKSIISGKKNLKINIWKIPINFHNGSNYDYHFIIKELAEEFENNLLALEKALEKT